MKQVQQAQLARPGDKVVPLVKGTRFSAIAADEPLYLVSHGNRATGRLRDVTTADLLAWLSHRDLGLPERFGGIVILSCYGGLGGTTAIPVSLAREVAQGLAGRVTAGVTVAGARGYSFGTPEFRRSGRSSVLPLALEDFYWAEDVDEMKTAWAAHRPTHPGGVLKSVFKCKSVDDTKTCGQNVRKAQATGGPAGDKLFDTALTDLVTDFATQAHALETKLQKTLDRVPGNTVAERAAHFARNPTARDVIDWNDAIDKQLALFHDRYLWTPAKEAFSVEKIP
ncbi:hypothetical protein ACPZ19_17100 [Amycolatopsis lurida]